MVQSVDRATPVQGVVGSISAPGDLYLLIGSALVICDRLKQKSWFARSVSAWQHVKMSDAHLETSPRDSLVSDESVKKP